MILRFLTITGLAALASISLTACESTQSRSAELEKKGATKLASEAGLKIAKENSNVKVTSTAVLSDANGSAVVVGLHNSSGQNLTDVPILIDVLDAKGKSVYKNDIPGIEPTLASIPYIAAGADADWVDDQVLASGKPKSVKVTVGASADSYSGALPKIQTSAPTLEGDPVSGIEATGTAVNKSGEEQGELLLYAIGRKGGKVVAAGRGVIEHFKATAKPLHYDIFFIGDPTGSDLELTQFPTLPGAKPE